MTLIAVRTRGLMIGAAAGLALTLAAAPAMAQSGQDSDPGIDIPQVNGAEMSSEEIIQRLSPKTRGIRVHAGGDDAPAAASDEEGLGQLSASFGSILFARNSAEIMAEAIPTLNEIGQALVSEELKSYRFGVQGHTDAAGENWYNKDLSQRRAEAVRNYLTDNFGIEPSRLKAEGLGESHLKDPTAPYSQTNRRVELVNFDS